MKLTELFKSVGERLNAKRVSEPKASIGIGMVDAEKLKTPPNVVFVPVEGKGSKPKTSGNVQSDGNGGFIVNDDPPALWDRDLQIACRVYGKSIDDCDAITEQLVEAWHEATVGQYTYEGEQWDTSGLVTGGVVLVTFFRIGARWNRTAHLLVRPETLVDTPTLEAQVAP